MLLGFVVLFAYYSTKTLNQVFILVNAQQQRIRYTHTRIHISTYVSKRLVLRANEVHDILFILLIFYAVEKSSNFFFTHTLNTTHFVIHL